MKNRSCWTEKREFREMKHSTASPHCFSFSKQLPMSAVSSQYELFMPKEFSGALLSHDDTSIILVNESGREYSVKYCVKRNSLRRGWKDFVIDQRLRKGNILSFQQIHPFKFKVCVTGASRSIEDGFQNNKAVGFVEGEEQMEETTCIDNTAAHKKSPVSRARAVDSQQILQKSEHATLKELLVVLKAEPLGYEDSQENTEDRMHSQIRKRLLDEIVLNENAKHVCIRSSRSTDLNDAYGGSTLPLHASKKNVHTAVPLGIQKSESALKFEDMKRFEDFKIQVNGKTLNREIPEDSGRRYYQLCCTQQRFLHDPVMLGRSKELVIGMILDIVGIAEVMKDADILTPIEKLESMRRTLKSFEDLGMTVGFLLAKVDKLIQIWREHQTLKESTKRIKADIESTRAAYNEKQTKIDYLMESSLADGFKIEELEAEASTLKDQGEKLSLAFKEVAR